MQTVFLVVGISCNSKGSESKLRMEGLLHSQAVKDSAAICPHGLSSLVTVTIVKGDCCFVFLLQHPMLGVPLQEQKNDLGFLEFSRMA